MNTSLLAVVIAGVAVSLSAQTTTTAAPAPASAAVKSDTTTKVVPATADTTKKLTAAKSDGDKPLELTLEQLAKYNGQNGQPAYVAFEGVIYEVTNAKGWKMGKHKGHTAGQDITKVIMKESPHGKSVMRHNKVVGKLVAAPAAAPAK